VHARAVPDGTWGGFIDRAQLEPVRPIECKAGHHAKEGLSSRDGKRYFHCQECPTTPAFTLAGFWQPGWRESELRPKKKSELTEIWHKLHKGKECPKLRSTIIKQILAKDAA
jgi:hypothetical protein